MMRRTPLMLSLWLVGCLSGDLSLSQDEPADMLDDLRELDAGGDAPDLFEPPDLLDQRPDSPAQIDDMDAPDAPPADPCAGVTCGAGAACEAGACVCGPGLTGDGQTCAPIDPSDTSLRTREQVCQRWRADYAERASAQWQSEPMAACEPGALHPDFVEDALRRLSLYRWLVGLGPVTSRPQHQETTQACATTLAASGRGLSHTLDSSWTCYSEAARAGAGSSNLAMGVSSPAASIDLYIRDQGVPSLGHRRWVFNPRMGVTGFGQRGVYSCMYSFDQSASGPSQVAYPAAGFFPQEALLGVWSFSSSRHSLPDSATVSVRRADTGAALSVSGVSAPGGGYGLPTLAWTVSGAARDIEYIVTLDNIGSSGPVTYRTTLISCP